MIALHSSPRPLLHAYTGMPASKGCMTAGLELCAVVSREVSSALQGRGRAHHKVLALLGSCLVALLTWLIGTGRDCCV